MSELTGNPVIDRYLQQDVSEGSDLYVKLMDKAETEAGQDAVQLIGESHTSAASGGVTPAMAEWYNSRIAQVRKSALTHVSAEAQALKIGNTPGSLEEIEEDLLRREQLERRTEETSKFSRDNAELLRDHKIAKNDYDIMRARETRGDAKHPPRWADWLVPIAIMIPESFLNYESFLASPLIQTGAMALGVTLVTGAAIGFSAFLAGRFWTAFQFYMQPDKPDQKQKGLRMIGTAAVLLLFALGVVGAARYYFLVPQIEEAVILGLTPPNLVWSTSSLLLGNVVVFLLGAAITYWLHDENPEYAEKMMKFRDLDRKLRRARHSQLMKPLNNIDRQFERNREQARRNAQQLETVEGYSAIRNQLSAIEGKDQAIVGAMQAYRVRLSSMRDSESGHFNSIDGIAQGGVTAKTFSREEFCNLPIKLYKW